MLLGVDPGTGRAAGQRVDVGELDVGPGPAGGERRDDERRRGECGKLRRFAHGSSCSSHQVLAGRSREPSVASPVGSGRGRCYRERPGISSALESRSQA